MALREMRTTSATGNKGRDGFTLIEMGVVVFILALLLAVAGPSLVRAFNDAVVSDAARKFALTCRQARLQAVTQQRPATVFVNLDQQRFWLAQPLPTADGALEEHTIKSVQLSGRVVLTKAEVPDAAEPDPKQAEIKFYPNGTCDAATVVVTGNDKNPLAVTLDPITSKPVVYAVK